MKTVIITGCAGLLGANLSRYLLDERYRVIGIDDLSGGYKEYLPSHENFVFYEINLADKNNQLDLIFRKEKPVACFHFAAYAAEGLSPFIRYFNYENNILSSMNIINNCITFDCKLIFTSSIAVYGDQIPPFNENITPCPVDPYGVAKYATEMDIKIAANQHGLKYNILRPHNVIGIYQNIWDKYRNVAGIFINNTINNQPILIYGDGEQTRAFSDISYYMEPFCNLINDFDNEIYNIGADKTFSINQLADIVQEVASHFGFKMQKKFVEARHEVKHAFCDHSKAKKELKFNDQTNLERLIYSLFEWAVTQKSRQQKTMSYEITKGLYDFWKTSD